MEHKRQISQLESLSLSTFAMSLCHMDAEINNRYWSVELMRKNVRRAMATAKMANPIPHTSRVRIPKFGNNHRIFLERFGALATTSALVSSCATLCAIVV